MMDLTNNNNFLSAVTPRFSEKYKTAAETALYSCYSSVLEVKKLTLD